MSFIPNKIIIFVLFLNCRIMRERDRYKDKSHADRSKDKYRDRSTSLTRLRRGRSRSASPRPRRELRDHSRSPRRVRSRSPSPRSRRDVRKRSRSRQRHSRSRSPLRRHSRERRRSRNRDLRRSRSRTPLKKDKKIVRTVPSAPKVTEEDLRGKTAEEQEMMKMMGFCNFDTTHGKEVDGNKVGDVHVILKRKYRQYMNRKGGFNRPLDFVA